MQASCKYQWQKDEHKKKGRKETFEEVLMKRK
jgi:hypothetical protein